MPHDAFSSSRAAEVKRLAADLGFDACGIADAAHPPDPDDHLDRWVSRGFHADMDWLARTRRERLQPAYLLPGVRSAVVVARNYYAPRPPAPAGAGVVSRYAWGRDYHRVLAKPIRKLASFLRGLYLGAETRVSVDTGPVLERAWAARAGVGWIGRNACLIHPDFGSWVFLGVVLTTVPLAPDAPLEERCGNCARCMEACPTGAIVEPHVVDARRCLSYLTVESGGEVPREFQRALGRRLFGCDACQEACPWNKASVPTDDPGFQPRPGQANPSLKELLRMDEAGFDERFAGTCIRRAGHERMMRNARLALNNTKR